MPLTLFRRLTPAILALTLAMPLSAPMSAQAQGVAGAFLAMREARNASDFNAAVRYLEVLRGAAPDDALTLESLTVSYLSLGQTERALERARELVRIEPDNRAAAMVLMAAAFADEDYDAALVVAEQDAGIHPLLDGLALAWAQLGVGRMSDALTTFDSLAGSDDLRPFALYCRALALALVGDVEGALEILEGSDAPVNGALNRRGYLAYAQLLGLSERYDDALALLTGVFANPNDPDVARLIAAFTDRRPVPFDVIGSARDGMAEVLAVMAGAMQQVDGYGEALIYGRAALWLNPDLVETTVLLGEIFETLRQPQLAADTYATVPDDSVFSMIAQIGQAQVLETLGQNDAARAVLLDMLDNHPQSVAAPQVLGDFERRMGDHRAAIAAYDRAFALLADQGAPVSWQMHFSRAVSHERLGEWTLAEADFRAALEIEPQQPTVLNYLGYSLVERGENLDEALDMIERAVAAEPDSGAIVDSLAWALFRLGRYAEALPHMERAVALMPTDPILNDHLGDVYWANGRLREARFQWSRALSFGPNPDLDDDRIRRKLEVGLDIVRAEAGEPALNARN